MYRICDGISAERYTDIKRNFVSFQAPRTSEPPQKRRRLTRDIVVDERIYDTSGFRVPESGETTRGNERAGLFDQNISAGKAEAEYI